MDDQEAKSIIEALLFMAGEPLTLNTIRKIIEIDKYNTERLVREIISDYSVKNTGLFIAELGEGYQMVTNPACAPWIKKLLSTAVPKKLTPSSLETLAIVAYKQPIIRAEIEAVRGVNSDGVVKTLLERRLVKILGRKEVPGRPLMYGTTNEFLQYFGLKDLSELPTLKEFEEVDIPEPPEGMVEDAGRPETSEEEGKEIMERVEQSNEENHVQGDDTFQYQDKQDTAVDQSHEKPVNDREQPSDEEVKSQ